MLDKFFVAALQTWVDLQTKFGSDSERDDTTHTPKRYEKILPRRTEQALSNCFKNDLREKGRKLVGFHSG